MSHAPPPPPPPTTPPAPEQSGWRKRKGQDYWERALNSFHSLIQPPVPSTAPPPTSSTPQPAPQFIRNINNNNTVCTDMDTSTNVKLSTAYYQTRNTRQAHNTTTVHNIDTGTTLNTTAPHIGSFDTDPDINSTFLASRTDNSKNILQNISLSFDPQDMQCISCKSTHNITIPAPDTPITFVATDQNFPGSLGGGGRISALGLFE